MVRLLLTACLSAFMGFAAVFATCLGAQDSGNGNKPGPVESGEGNSQQEQAYAIIVKGNKSMTEKDLLGAAASELQKFAQRGHRKADIDDAAFEMRDAYLQAGFAFVQVDYAIEQEGDRLAVVFAIQEGQRVEVENIIFKGNRNIPSEKLLGFFGVNGNGWDRKQRMPYVEASTRDAFVRLRDFYREEGYIDIRVKGPETAFSEDRTRAVITVDVEEGPQYIIAGIELNGDLAAEMAPELEKIRDDLVGKPYYVRRKLLLRTNLEDAYDAAGYAEAKVEIEVETQPEPGRIILTAYITSGEKIILSEIVISGNKSTREAFIRARLRLKPGDIYTRAARMESFRNLYDSGLFAKIAIELPPPREDGSRVLEVRVEELPSREYYVEPGWGSYEQLRLRAGAFEKNLLGTGRKGRIDGLVSMKGETVTLSYTDPWLLNSDISLNVPLNFENRDEPSYTSEDVSLSLLFSRKFGRKLTMTAGYQYKMTQLYDLADDTPLPKGEEDYNKGTVGIQAVWDTRDDVFYPSTGVRLASGFDISLPPLGSEIEFSRLTLGCRYFMKLPLDLILGLRATTGLIIPLGNQISIPIDERFFNGGDTTVRSYKHSELGPKDENNEPTGGLGYNVFSVELRKRFYKNFAATLYVDAGNVSPNKALQADDFVPYTSSSDLLDDTLQDFFSDFKFGIGVGLQYLLPVGPIRIDVAYNPDPVEMWNEDTWVFHFSFGMAF